MSRLIAEFQNLQREVASLQREVREGRRWNAGQDVLAFTGAAFSNIKTLPHGLPGSPRAVVVTSIGSPDVDFSVQGWTATTFDVRGYYGPGTSGNYGFTWAAFL